MVMKPESSSWSQQSVHSQATLSSNTLLVTLSLLATWGWSVCWVALSTSVITSLSISKKGKRTQCFSVNTKRWDVSTSHRRTLICSFWGHSREEVAQPGRGRHWPGCSPLYVIRAVCQALGQVAVDIQLCQPMSRGAGRVIGREGAQPEYVSCTFTPLLGADYMKTRDSALGWQNGTGVPPMKKGLSRPCSWVQGPQGTRLLKHLHLRAGTLCLKNPKNPPVVKGVGGLSRIGPKVDVGVFPTPSQAETISSIRQTLWVFLPPHVPQATLPSSEGHWEETGCEG